MQRAPKREASAASVARKSRLHIASREEYQIFKHNPEPYHSQTIEPKYFPACCYVCSDCRNGGSAQVARVAGGLELGLRYFIAFKLSRLLNTALEESRAKKKCNTGHLWQGSVALDPELSTKRPRGSKLSVVLSSGAHARSEASPAMATSSAPGSQRRCSPKV